VLLWNQQSIKANCRHYTAQWELQVVSSFLFCECGNVVFEGDRSWSCSRHSIIRPLYKPPDMQNIHRISDRENGIYALLRVDRFKKGELGADILVKQTALSVHTVVSSKWRYCDNLYQSCVHKSEMNNIMRLIHTSNCVLVFAFSRRWIFRLWSCGFLCHAFLYVYIMFWKNMLPIAREFKLRHPERKLNPHPKAGMHLEV
jgi:hypothetical protein